MLVKVSKKYFGTLGIFNEDTNSIIQKDKTSAPFELDDALALPHLKNGILVMADDKEKTSSEIPAVFEVKQEVVDDLQEPEAVDEIPSDIPEDIPDELPIDEEDLDSITDYKVLKKMAKEVGINPFGKNKDELREAIREAKA